MAEVTSGVWPVATLMAFWILEVSLIPLASAVLIEYYASYTASVEPYFVINFDFGFVQPVPAIQVTFVFESIV